MPPCTYYFWKEPEMRHSMVSLVFTNEIDKKPIKAHIANGNYKYDNMCC